MDSNGEVKLEFVAASGTGGWYACVCLTDTLGLPLRGPYDTERQAVAGCHELAAEGAQILRSSGIHAVASSETN